MRYFFSLLALMLGLAAATYAADSKPGPAAPSSASAISGKEEGPVVVVPEETVAPDALATAASDASSSGAAAPKAAALTVTVGGLAADGQIPEKFAYCAPDAARHTKNGGNRNPEISWSKGPEGTKSYALIVVDPDVPATFDDADKVGKTIPDAMPRQDFYHWVLVDIPATINALPEGLDSSGVGAPKRVGSFAYGVRGANDYGKFMGGPAHGGYDGPCPPWNDARLHHYHFVVYALDTPSLGLSGKFTGPQAEAALKGHMLAQGEAVGTYSQNLALLVPKAAPAEDNAGKKEAD